MREKKITRRPFRSRLSISRQTTEERRQTQPSHRYIVPDSTDSLDVSQRIERKLAQYNASQSIARRWIFEILSWILSAACVIAIIVILVYLQDKPLSKWPIGLTINTILSKIASAALILPISEAIGQLKWSWFHGTKSKEMLDFEIFDKASRGPWGSIMLLFRTKGRSLAALGAFLTLLLLATDTFFQQATELPERWTYYGNSTVPRTIRYEPDYNLIYRNGTELVQEDPNFARVMRSFFYSNGTQPVPFGNGTQPEIPVSCPTSKCEWEPYETLGVCSACADISDILTYACLESRLDWLSNLTGYGSEETYPNGTACGYFLNATSETPVLMSGYRIDPDDSNADPGETLLLRTLPLVTIEDRIPLYGKGSIKFQDVYFPLLDALIVSAVDGSASSVHKNMLPVAQECILSLCVKTIKSSYSWANYEEDVVDTFLNTTRSDQEFPWLVITEGEGQAKSFDYYFRGNISIYTPTTDETTAGYGASNATVLHTVSILDEMFPSLLTVANQSAPPKLRVKFWVMNQNFQRDVKFSPWLSPNNVTQYMERFATALTNVLRSQPDGHIPFPGKAYSLVTFVSVRWEWLTFPITLLFLCLIFLAATIRKTAFSVTQDEIGVWKTSAMPTLIYGLPKDAYKDFTSPAAWADSSNAKRVRVRLVPKKGWRVSGQVYTPTTPNFPVST